MQLRRALSATVVLALAIGCGAWGAVWFSRQAREGTSLVYLSQGRDAMSHGAHVEAIAYLNRAVSLDPRSWLACTSLGRAYEQNGNTTLSIGQYSVCLSMSKSQQMNAEVLSLEKTIKELNDRAGNNQPTK
jgi:hypothetical protein